MAALYDRMLAASEEACLREWRRNLLAGVKGEVLEVGTGTGLNLEHYPAAVTKLVLSEPDPFMRRKLERRVAELGRAAVDVVDAPLERLPFPDASFDYVVSTLVMCSVTNPVQSIVEIQRVLRPGGALVFIEHVAADSNPKRFRWQRRLEPIWKRVMGNCHLTRDTASTIEAANLQLDGPIRESMRKAVPIVRPTIRGLARKPA